MKLHKWSDIKAKSRHKLTPEMVAEDAEWVRRELLEMSLREIREMVGQTQVEAAEKMGKTQSELSRLERRDDSLVSSLRGYVEALGGELEIVVRFGDRSVKLRGV